MGRNNRLLRRQGLIQSLGLKPVLTSPISTISMWTTITREVGFNIGVFTKASHFKGVSIQPELLYTTKGAKLNYTNFTLGAGEYRFNLNYLELPVLAVFNLGKNFNLHLGGYAAYLTNSNITDAKNDGTIDEIADLNASDFNRWDAGLVGGLGFDINKVTIGARYNYGLVMLVKQEMFPAN
jgi:hypothetical protein